MTDWWQTSVFYALFPYSFKDSNGDGIGDINGIIEGLDYLAWLGVDAVWLGPLYPSPMIDAGYDIADFCGIDPRFGTMLDFDRMVEAMHRRGMRVILDFVPNHTSDQHPWFGESRSSRSNARRDWYIWRDGRPRGAPPTNWIDNTQQPAWTRDEQTGQFYYHRFLPQQPDLNLRNPAVIEALQEALRFWLDRGVDGFRMDAAASLVEDEFFRDEPVDEDLKCGPPGWMDHLFTEDRPETRSVIAAFRRFLDQYPDKVFLGEVQAPLARFMEYYGRRAPGFHLPLNNQILKTKPWSARKVDASIDQYMILLPEHAWPNWVLGSHDLSRLATRVGPDQARVAAMLTLTLPGTPFIYYGDEIGTQDLRLRSDQTRDPYHQYGVGRDPERAPLAWSTGVNAGFTEGTPWLPMAPDAQSRNVETLRRDTGSLLHLYRELISLRRTRPALFSRDYQPVRAEGDVLAFRRPDPGRTLLVVLNFAGEPQDLQLGQRGRIVLSTFMDRRDAVEDILELRPNEGVVIELS